MPTENTIIAEQCPPTLLLRWAEEVTADEKWLREPESHPNWESRVRYLSAQDSSQRYRVQVFYGERKPVKGFLTSRMGRFIVGGLIKQKDAMITVEDTVDSERIKINVEYGVAVSSIQTGQEGDPSNKKFTNGVDFQSASVVYDAFSKLLSGRNELTPLPSRE